MKASFCGPFFKYYLGEIHVTIYRSAYGTLVMDIIARHGGIPESDEGSRKNPRDTGVVSYYDLEKDAWRCFKADSIQEIDQDYGIS